MATSPGRFDRDCAPVLSVDDLASALLDACSGGQLLSNTATTRCRSEDAQRLGHRGRPTLAELATFVRFGASLGGGARGVANGIVGGGGFVDLSIIQPGNSAVAGAAILFEFDFPQNVGMGQIGIDLGGGTSMAPSLPTVIPEQGELPYVTSIFNPDAAKCAVLLFPLTGLGNLALCCSKGPSGGIGVRPLNSRIYAPLGTATQMTLLCDNDTTRMVLDALARASKLN